MSEEFSNLGEEYNRISEEYSGPVKNVIESIDPSCHKCNATKVFMVQCANEDGNACMTCMKCLFNIIIETGVEQFCKDNKDFEGMLFSYKDKFKT